MSQQFIHTWNGAGFFLSTSWVDSDCLKLHNDASGTLGYGKILGNKWFQGRWETHQQLNTLGISIAWQEFKQLSLPSFKKKLKTHMLENYFN